MALTARQEETARRESVPFAKFQYVSVTFTTAGADVDVPHDLRPADPESVRWLVVSTEGTTSATVGGWDGPVSVLSSGSVYRDNSASRLAWSQERIWLRSMYPGSFRLLLFLEA
jgi:hypothetical protein